MKRANCICCRKSIYENDIVSCKGCELVFYCGQECYLKNKKEHDEWCMDVQLYILTKEEHDDTAKFEIDGGNVRKESVMMQAQALLKMFQDVNKYLNKGDSEFGVINNWKDYFGAIDFTINPILCSILQWVMTTYDIIRRYFGEFGTKESLKIHFIGTELEAQNSDTFAELEKLFPDLRFDISFIGPDIEEGYTGKLFESERVKCIGTKGLYHQIKQLDKPDLVIGFNAGLPAYLSWIPTIQYLKENKIPSYFTEYCWRGYHVTLLRLSLLDGVTLSQASINQFKSLIRIPDKSSKIPQFSNHIIFKLNFLE